MQEVQKQIAEFVKNNKVVLYMKGSVDFPQCGFSAHAVKIIKAYDVDFVTVNVLDDPEIRDGIKIYSSWPTIPQLYVNGVFIGGCDILNDMHEANELDELFA
jgi:monothiol glutaredoxin